MISFRKLVGGTVLCLLLAGCKLNVGLATSMTVIDDLIREIGEDVANVTLEIEMPSSNKCREFAPKVKSIFGNYLQDASGESCFQREMDTFLKISGNIKILSTDQESVSASGKTVIEIVVYRQSRYAVLGVHPESYERLTGELAKLFDESSVKLNINDLSLSFLNDTRKPRSIATLPALVNGDPVISGNTIIPARSRIEIKFSDVERAFLEKNKWAPLAIFPEPKE